MFGEIMATLQRNRSDILDMTIAVEDVARVLFHQGSGCPKLPKTEYVAVDTIFDGDVDNDAGDNDIFFKSETREPAYNSTGLFDLTESETSTSSEDIVKRQRNAYRYATIKQEDQRRTRVLEERRKQAPQRGEPKVSSPDTKRDRSSAKGAPGKVSIDLKDSSSSDPSLDFNAGRYYNRTRPAAKGGSEIIDLMDSSSDEDSVIVVSGKRSNNNHATALCKEEVDSNDDDQMDREKPALSGPPKSIRVQHHPKGLPGCNLS
jgi:hypothetical protein